MEKDEIKANVKFTFYYSKHLFSLNVIYPINYENLNNCT